MRKQLLIIGVFPPPVRGMPLVTQAIVERLQEFCSFHRVNLSRHPPLKRLFRFYKVAKVFYAALKIIQLRFYGMTTVYLPVNAGPGLYLTLGLVALTRLLRQPVILHHHSWAYLSHYDWRMSLICRLIRSQGHHVVLCEMMQQQFCQHYPNTQLHQWRRARCDVR